MAPLETLLLLALGGHAFAGPLVSKNFDRAAAFNPATELMERDVPCSPENMVAGVSRCDCVKKQTLDSNGHCSAPLPGTPNAAGCLAYCEVRLTIYGQEVPFQDSSCEEFTACNIQETRGVTIINSFQFNLGFNAKQPLRRTELSALLHVKADPTAADATKAAELTFNAGATYTYSVQVSYTVTNAQTMQLNQSQCGYWTFIPFLIEPCGTLTAAGITTQPAGYYNTDDAQYCDKTGDLTDTPNWCNTTPYQTTTGHGDGVIVFEWTNCTNNALLPMSEQNAAYNYPGVSTGLKKHTTKL